MLKLHEASTFHWVTYVLCVLHHLYQFNQSTWNTLSLNLSQALSLFSEVICMYLSSCHSGSDIWKIIRTVSSSNITRDVHIDQRELLANTRNTSLIWTPWNHWGAITDWPVKTICMRIIQYSIFMCPLYWRALRDKLSVACFLIL